MSTVTPAKMYNHFVAKSTTSIGREAERAAAEYLEKLGFRIVVFNWRTRRAEIDIVAEEIKKISLLKKQKIIHFVEVKYRKTSDFGDGLEYITPKKLIQLEFATSEWVHENEWAGDYQIDAIAVSGNSAEGWGFDYRPNVVC